MYVLIKDVRFFLIGGTYIYFIWLSCVAHTIQFFFTHGHEPVAISMQSIVRIHIFYSRKKIIVPMTYVFYLLTSLSFRPDWVNNLLNIQMFCSIFYSCGKCFTKHYS